MEEEKEKLLSEVGVLSLQVKMLDFQVLLKRRFCAFETKKLLPV